MTETAEKSRKWRGFEWVVLTLGLTVPCIVLVRAVFDSILPAMVVGFVAAMIVAWINV